MNTWLYQTDKDEMYEKNYIPTERNKTKQKTPSTHYRPIFV